MPVYMLSNDAPLEFLKYSCKYFAGQGYNFPIIYDTVFNPKILNIRPWLYYCVRTSPGENSQLPYQQDINDPAFCYHPVTNFPEHILVKFSAASFHATWSKNRGPPTTHSMQTMQKVHSLLKMARKQQHVLLKMKISPLIFNFELRVNDA